MDTINPNEEEKLFIVGKFNEGTTEIKKLTEIYCDKYHPSVPPKQRDGRSVYGRAVKSILAEIGEKGKSSHDYQPVEEELKPEGFMSKVRGFFGRFKKKK